MSGKSMNECGIVQNMDWTGLDSWTGQLDWTVGLDYWTGFRMGFFPLNRRNLTVNSILKYMECF